MVFGFLGKLAGGAGSDAASFEAEGFNRGIEELRRQFGITQDNVNPFVQAGQGALPGVVQGTTAGGLDQRFSEIFNTDIFGSLVDERTRAVQGQLGASGNMRSGAGLEEIADVPTQIGLMLEKLLTDRGTNLAATGQNAALGLGSLGSRNAQGIAGLFGREGVSRGAGALTDQQAGAGLFEQITGGITSAPDIIKGGGAIGSLFGFSDPRLKENIEMTGAIGDLGVFRWDWIEGAKGTIVEACSTCGFMSDEVKQKYPQHVGEFGGFDVIYYKDLLDELENKWPH